MLMKKMEGKIVPKSTEPASIVIQLPQLTPSGNLTFLGHSTFVNGYRKLCCFR